MALQGWTAGAWGVATTVLLLATAGCWQKAERDMEARVDGMDRHLIELYQAADAVRDGDHKGYRKAMKSLASTGDLPGVDGPQLEAVRTAAQAAASMEQRGQQAQGLVAVAGACVSCHTQLGGDAPLHGVDGDATSLALSAYVWRDDALWSRAADAAKAEGAPWPTADAPWAQRGVVITRLLTR